MKKNPVTGGHPEQQTLSGKTHHGGQGIGKGTSLGQSSLSLSHDLTTLPSVDNFMPGIVLRNEDSWQMERLIG